MIEWHNDDFSWIIFSEGPYLRHLDFTSDSFRGIHFHYFHCSIKDYSLPQNWRFLSKRLSKFQFIGRVGVGRDFI